jgi:hypothetical protein
MPFYVKEVDVVDEVARHDSVLVVVCRFCPAASLATRTGRTYLSPLRRGLDTPVFEEYVDDLVDRLEARGVRAEVVRGNVRNFAVCMWTAARKERLRKLAAERDAVLVLGCRGALETVGKMVESTGCRIYHGMEDEAVLSVTPKVSFPLRITLEPFSMTPVEALGAPADRPCEAAGAPRAVIRVDPGSSRDPVIDARRAGSASRPPRPAMRSISFSPSGSRSRSLPGTPCTPRRSG